jgi:hypothetical protein
MGQFDLKTSAALTQLEFEELSKTPGGEFAEVIGDLISLTGVAGPFALAGGASNLFLKVRRLAGASYGSNLIYTISAVRDDLVTLSEGHEELRGRIASLPTDPKFAEAISAVALRAMHTSVKDRLRRLARLIVNGVKADDLEVESLDDMMRAAVELKDADIVLLGKIHGSQGALLRQQRINAGNWFGDVQSYWNDFVNSGALDASKHLLYRSSFSRLESHGLIQKFREISTAGVGLEPYALLEEGMKFYERLQDLAVKE